MVLLVLILLIRIFPSDQKHSTRNSIKFAHAIFLVLNVDSRKIKQKTNWSDTESRNSTQMRSNFAKSHYTENEPILRVSWILEPHELVQPVLDPLTGCSLTVLTICRVDHIKIWIGQKLILYLF